MGAMRAAVVEAPSKLAVARVEVPAPGPGELLVRLEGTGVCPSNLPVWQGRPWFTYPLDPGAPGHEGWGIVERVGDGVETFATGVRVAFLSSHAYGEYDLTTAGSAVRLPDALAGRPFPAEPIGCAVNVGRRARITAGETVAVVGVGFLGALVVQIAARAGAHVIAISRREYALDLARLGGASEVLALDDHGRVIDRVRELTGGELCDCVIEAVGTQEPLDLAAEITRVRGRLVVAGYHQDGPRQVNMQLWNWRGLDVINAHERDEAMYAEGMREAVARTVAGELDPMPLLTHPLPLDRLHEGFQLMETRPDGFVKSYIVF